MLILAIDLGKAKSLACWYQTGDTSHEFRTIPTRPGDFHTLLADRPVDRVVIEICDAAGWVVDLCRTLGIPIQVADTNQQAWNNLKGRGNNLKGRESYQRLPTLYFRPRISPGMPRRSTGSCQTKGRIGQHRV